MKRLAGLIVIAVVAVTVLIGCATGPRHRFIWKSDPEVRSVSNEYFDAKLTPVFVENQGYVGFALEIKNKTEKNIEVNWNKTLFIHQGQTSGGFMFPGSVYAERNNPKLPDVVFPNVFFEKGLMPSNLAYFSRTHPIGYDAPGWYHRSMSPGANGVYLTVIVDGKEINETLTVNLSSTSQ